MPSIESRKRICCNCGNNKRSKGERGNIVCNCEIDGHYISYVECMTGWCPKWKRETKWDELKEKNNK